MRANFVINDELLVEAMKLSQVPSKHAVVELALRELVARYRQQQLRQLKGQDLIDPDYDVRKLRQAMTCGPD